MNPLAQITVESLYDVAPELILLGGGIVILLLEAFASGLRRSFTALASLTVLAAGWAVAMLLPLRESFNSLIVADGVTGVFSMVVLAGALLGLFSSQTYLRREGIENGEYQALFLWCVAGLLFMLRSTELLTIFLSLELLSLCLYALAGFHRRVVIGSEAALKYFLMGAFASAFVLMGLALTYGETGTTRLPEVLAAFSAAVPAAGQTVGGVSFLGGLGIVLLVAGFGFKMSLVPFHAWAPDTYQGAPSPFVGFLSVAPKAASALVMIRVLTAAYGTENFAWSNLIAFLAVASMVVGNLFALVQKDIKRMLAYSGIAHMGYLLIALTSLTPRTVVPVAVYLAAYTLMNGGAFAVITLLYDRPGEQHLIKDLSGVGYRHPILGVCLMICMLSLGGLPPTFGFIGKYLVFQHAVAQGDVWLAVIGVLTSLVGVVYYLRVVYHLYMKPELAEPRPVTHGGWAMAAAVLGALGTLILGLFPGELVEFLLAAVGG